MVNRLSLSLLVRCYSEHLYTSHATKEGAHSSPSVERWLLELGRSSTRNHTPVQVGRLAVGPTTACAKFSADKLF
jgi:hypothetical protein